MSEYDVKLKTIYAKNPYRNVLGNLNNFKNNMVNKDIKYLSKNLNNIFSYIKSKNIIAVAVVKKVQNVSVDLQ